MSYTDSFEEYSEPDLGKPSLAIRLRRGWPRKKSSAVPVTEMKYKIRGPRINLGKLLHGVFNTLFLGVLSLALLALIAAFTYEMINHPAEMAKWANDLIASAQGIIQAVVGAVHSG